MNDILELFGRMPHGILRDRAGAPFSRHRLEGPRVNAEELIEVFEFTDHYRSSGDPVRHLIRHLAEDLYDVRARDGIFDEVRVSQSDLVAMVSALAKGDPDWRTNVYLGLVARLALDLYDARRLPASLFRQRDGEGEQPRTEGM